MLFWGSAKLSFGWYKVTKNNYEGTTTKKKAFRSPKTWYLTHFHVPIWMPKTAFLIIIRTYPILSSNMSKNGKKEQKSVIASITTKSVISRLSQIDFQSTGCVPVSWRPWGPQMHA